MTTDPSNMRRRSNSELMAVTASDIRDILEKRGYRVIDVRNDSPGRIHVITEKAVPFDVMEIVKACTPAMTVTTFAVRGGDTIPRPKVLDDWWKIVSKNIKK